MTPFRAGVTLKTLVTAVYVPLADNTLGVLLAVRSGTSVILRVGGCLVIRDRLCFTFCIYFRVIRTKSLLVILWLTRRSWHSR